jgi:hypothetical protein
MGVPEQHRILGTLVELTPNRRRAGSVRPNCLRRYTELPALLHLLAARKITLLDPRSWDDRNDSHYLEVYRKRQSLKAVLALCFTETTESYHHWRVFADGPSGVCIVFKGPELINAVKRQKGIRFGRVKYLTLETLRAKSNPLATRHLPFRKRWAFAHEVEYRMIYDSPTKSISALDIVIPLSCIERVTLSPWLAEPLKPTLRDIVHSIPGCSSVKVARSTLISNDEWKRFGDDALDE